MENAANPDLVPHAVPFNYLVTIEDYDAPPERSGLAIYDPEGYDKDAEIIEQFDDFLIIGKTIPSPLEGRPPSRLIETVARSTDTAPLLRAFFQPGFQDVYDDGKSRSAYGPFEQKRDLLIRAAEQGIGLMMLARYEGKMLVDPETGRRSSLYTYAANAVNCIESQGLGRTTLPLIGHSMGGKITELTEREASSRGYTCFKEAPVVLLASAGIDSQENMTKLALHFGQNALQAEKARRVPMAGDTVEDSERSQYNVARFVQSFRASARNNPISGAFEYRDLSQRRNRIDLVQFSSRVGSVAIVAYSGDRVFPEANASRSVDEVFDGRRGRPVPDNISYHMPYSPELTQAGTARQADGRALHGADVLGRQNSSHNDCLIHPERVAGMLANVLGVTALRLDMAAFVPFAADKRTVTFDVDDAELIVQD